MWNDNEFNSTFSSPGGGNSGKEIKKNLIKHIVPVTGQIVQLCNQVEGENSIFEFKHLNFNQVCLIGIIRSVIKRANDITYLVDDMTSDDISVKLQSDDSEEMESDEPRPTHAQFMENQYVKVYGIIKSLQGQKCIQAFKIMPIKDLNEITHHILECMNASIHYSSKSCGDNLDMPMNGGNPLKNANLNGTSFENNVSNGLSSLHGQVSNLIKQAKTSEGMHIKEICSYFKSFPESKIRDALEFLSTEGHIYSTIDDEHFKSTESC